VAVTIDVCCVGGTVTVVRIMQMSTVVRPTPIIGAVTL
jgi:hypothetical protein